MLYLIQLLSSTDKLPWLYCDNAWNTEDCRPYSFLASTDLATTTTPAPTTDSWRETTPAAEYFDNFRPSILCILVLWVLILLPLVQGSKSLLKSFSVGYPLFHFLNALLFFRAISIPGIGSGYQLLYRPDFSGYAHEWFWLNIFTMSLGGWFSAYYGCLFVVGKYIEESIFPIPHSSLLPSYVSH